MSFLISCFSRYYLIPIDETFINRIRVQKCSLNAESRKAIMYESGLKFTVKGRIFFLTWVLIKTASNKFFKFCAKSFSDSVRYRYLFRFHVSRNIFMNTSEGNWFLILLIMLPKHVHMSRKIEIKYLFHLTMFFMSSKLPKHF